MESNQRTANELWFDLDVFSLDTVKKTLYRFADKASFDLEIVDKRVQVRVSSLNPLAVTTDSLITLIKNELIDQDLRDTISRETRDIRTLILANAFSDSGLVEK